LLEIDADPDRTKMKNLSALFNARVTHFFEISVKLRVFGYLPFADNFKQFFQLFFQVGATVLGG
jgi:hypothetical protein